MKQWVLAVLVVAASASAQEVGQRWSVVGGRTVGQGSKAVVVDVGWPGVGVAGWFGAASGVDLGVRASFVYGVEGAVSAVRPGVKGQLLLKLRLFDGDRTSVALTAEPGVFFHSALMSQTLLGVAVPLGLKVGFASSSAVHLGLSLEVPLWFQVGPTMQVTVPILAGLGTEYFITSQWLVFTRIRMGPSITLGKPADFALDAQLGLGYRF